MKEIKLNPLLKWTGGKTQELKIIKEYLPFSFDNYYEPFLGGGAVWLSVDTSKHDCYVNDYSFELIYLYNFIKEKNNIFLNYISEFSSQWKLIRDFFDKNKKKIVLLYLDFEHGTIAESDAKNSISIIINELLDINNLFNENNVFIKSFNKNVFDKFKRINKNNISKGTLSEEDLEKNLITAFFSSLYMGIRYLYNREKKDKNNIEFLIALYFIIRNYAYGGMFRYNKSGDFNVPYGGISYNSKNLDDKLDYFLDIRLIEHLSKSHIFQGDFEDFLTIKSIPTVNDFIFLDPPYDSEFSSYEGNEFDKAEQIRLSSYLINKCQAKWMIIIKYTDFIYDLYNKEGINIIFFDKKYQVSFMNRNEQKVQHLIIRNY